MILLTGGSGRLGLEIQKLIDVWAPSHDEFDILNPKLIPSGVELIIHAAAYTNVNLAEEEQSLCYKTNVIGTRNLALSGISMIYISTDSVFDGSIGNYKEDDIPYPKNFYSLSKLLGEHEIRNGVIVRCCPKNRPWAHHVACEDRFFSAEYQDETAKKIVKAVSMFNMLPRVIHIGSKRRSHYEMALETRPDVKPIHLSNYSVYRGHDTSLDCSLWDSIQ